jgi:hypothetical protein
LGASGHLRGRTGLSACIFFVCGKKGYRFNPLRGLKTGILAGFWPWILPAAKSIYPPKADSNRNSGILPPPFLSFGFCGKPLRRFITKPRKLLMLAGYRRGSA